MNDREKVIDWQNIQTKNIIIPIHSVQPWLATSCLDSIGGCLLCQKRGRRKISLMEEETGMAHKILNFLTGLRLNFVDL
uniref:Uncharacterized protein n=1 Tax=Romanomermis culicivorax TaxID=13658 RepID=A0A915L769_ROMCU